MCIITRKEWDEKHPGRIVRAGLRVEKKEKNEYTISVYAKETPAQEDDIYKTKYDDDFFDDEDDYSSSETGTYLLFKTYYEFEIQPDLSNVTIDKTSQTLYVSDYNWSTPSFTFKLNSDVMLNDYDDEIDVTYTSSNNKIDVYGYLENNIITLIPNQTGQTSVTITINNKKFTVKIKTVLVNISKNSLLMSKKQVKQLKVKGVKSGIKWSSSNSKIASVSSAGKVKANAKAYMDELSKQWEELPPYFISSSESKMGHEEILSYIDSINKSLKE